MVNAWHGGWQLPFPRQKAAPGTGTRLARELRSLSLYFGEERACKLPSSRYQCVNGRRVTAPLPCHGKQKRLRWRALRPVDQEGYRSRADSALPREQRG